MPWEHSESRAGKLRLGVGLGVNAYFNEVSVQVIEIN